MAAQAGRDSGESSAVDGGGGLRVAVALEPKRDNGTACSDNGPGDDNNKTARLALEAGPDDVSRQEGESRGASGFAQPDGISHFQLLAPISPGRRRSSVRADNRDLPASIDTTGGGKHLQAGSARTDNGIDTTGGGKQRQKFSAGQHMRTDSKAALSAGDERALPDYIVTSQTMEEVDAVTGAWEAAVAGLLDGDFWRAVIDDISGLRRRAPLHLAAKIRAGVPWRVRGVVWQTLTAARSTYLQTVYAQLAQEYSPHERMIRRDLPRTFPKIAVFRGEGGSGQQRLFRVLRAYSLYDAEVGYCQGLGFIIGPLLLTMRECEAFCVLVRLMETYDLRGMFTEDMAGLHLRLYQFHVLAAEIVPDVVAHLDAHGVVPAMYAPAWFLSLFAYTMPLGFVLRAMDVIMADGAPESIVRIGIALLQRNSALILSQADFESAVAVLNGGLYDETSNPRDRPGFVLEEAARLAAVVTRARLDELEAQYCRTHGVVLKGRPSASGAAPVSAAPAAAAPKFLGWPWGGGGGGGSSRDAQTGGPISGPISSPISPRVLEQPLRGEVKTRESGESIQTAVDEGDESPAAAVLSPGAWRDEVLEPLERQLHDARVTSATHRDALSALQAEHDALRAELAVAKAERAAAAEDNERLRLHVRRADERAAASCERTRRAEDALIAARVDLAEADEERALLVRQLSNLRKFISAESAGDQAGGSADQQPRSRVFSIDGGSRLSPQPKPPGRFSISGIAANLSAIRDAITAPPPTIAAAVTSPPPTPVPRAPDSASSRPHASIPLAALHRSKTTPTPGP
ncbi:hypothetical protein GGI02_001061 [Coemansia sp. RSA 2322]|nr:hypothetical protein GGI02_001061 [Coemansia sp. RSA 2322]